eukprot:scaffold132810_cov54-Phaeocystis_antarctica.AAC.1
MAQYVMIQLPGTGRILNLAEVEVYSFPPPPSLPPPPSPSPPPPMSPPAPPSPPSISGLVVTSELTLDTNASPDGFSYSSVVIAAGATLKATGSNPLIIKVEFLVDIQGTIDLSGGKGGNSPGDHKAAGGGAGGGALKISAPTITIGPAGAIH